MTNNTIKLAVDGSYGIHVPERFFVMYPQFLSHLNDEDQAIMQDPYSEGYFEVWDHFISNFCVRFPNDPHEWNLYQDGDVFFVREDHVWE